MLSAPSRTTPLPNCCTRGRVYNGKTQVFTGFSSRMLKAFPGFFLQLTLRKEKETKGRNEQKEPGGILGKVSTCFTFRKAHSRGAERVWPWILLPPQENQEVRGESHRRPLEETKGVPRRPSPNKTECQGDLGALSSSHFNKTQRQRQNCLETASGEGSS